MVTLRHRSKYLQMFVLLQSVNKCLFGCADELRDLHLKIRADDGMGVPGTHPGCCLLSQRVPSPGRNSRKKEKDRDLYQQGEVGVM